MTGKRLLLDTVFIQALLNKRDSYHRQALAFLPTVRGASEVWVTEAVLLEVGNALSAINRLAAAEFIRGCYRTSNMRVVAVDSSLLGLALISMHRDRTKTGALPIASRLSSWDSKA